MLHLLQNALSAMSVRQTILAELERAASEQNRTLAPLSDNLALLASGLDSLCVAIAIARLKEMLGFEPFATAEGIPLPTTVGDFIKAYEDAARA